MSFASSRGQALQDYYASYDDRSINPVWQRTDDFIESTLIPSDPVLEAALNSHVENDLPLISVNPSNGKLLYLLALSKQAVSILEIGTLAGYSTIWLAKAILDQPQRKLVTLEFDEKHAAVAEDNIKRAGYADFVSVRVGDGVKTCQNLIDEGQKFDFVFIDADKPAYPKYLELVLQLAKKGTVIVADNVIRQGAVSNSKSKDEKVRGVQQYFKLLGQMERDGRLSSTATQTVDAKGYDGFSYSIVL